MFDILKPNQAKVHSILKPEVNVGANILTDKLGIKFDPAPQEFRLDGNIFRAFPYLPRDIQLQVAVSMLGVRKLLANTWLPPSFSAQEWNEYYVKDNQDLWTILSRNMEFYLSQVNPDLNKPDSTEKKVVYLFTKTGIMNWCIDLAYTRTHFDYFTDENFGKEFENGHVEKWRQGYCQTVGKLIGAEDKLEIRAIKVLLPGIGHYTEQPNFQFIDIVMKYLIGSGLSTAGALICLIKNPPSTLQQISDPGKYAQDLLNRPD